MKIVNLTSHRLTQTQAMSISGLYPHAKLDLAPHGQLFYTIEDRQEWARRSIEELNDGDIAIVGGDTAAFMLLAIYACQRSKAVRFVAASAKRRRNEQGIFRFEFAGWMDLATGPTLKER